MAVTQAIDFAAETKRFFQLFDSMAKVEIRAAFADDVQGVDELSGKWLRGRGAIDEYFAQLEEMDVSDPHSSLSDIHSQQWGDIALVTCMAAQTYSVGGDEMAIRAPISVLYRRLDDGWKISLIHAVPLPESG